MTEVEKIADKLATTCVLVKSGVANPLQPDLSSYNMSPKPDSIGDSIANWWSGLSSSARHGLIGAALGGAGGAAIPLFQDDEPGKSKTKSVLRNALLGMLAGGGLAGGASLMLDPDVEPFIDQPDDPADLPHSVAGFELPQAAKELLKGKAPTTEGEAIGHGLGVGVGTTAVSRLAIPAVQKAHETARALGLKVPGVRNVMPNAPSTLNPSTFHITNKVTGPDGDVLLKPKEVNAKALAALEAVMGPEGALHKIGPKGIPEGVKNRAVNQYKKQIGKGVDPVLKPGLFGTAEEAIAHVRPGNYKSPLFRKYPWLWALAAGAIAGGLDATTNAAHLPPVTKTKLPVGGN